MAAAVNGHAPDMSEERADALVSKLGRFPRRPPDYTWLIARMDAYAARDHMYTAGKISYNQIGERIGRPSSVYGIARRKYKPDPVTLALLADWAGEPREVWLRRGGFGDPPDPLQEPDLPDDVANAMAASLLATTQGQIWWSLFERQDPQTRARMIADVEALEARLREEGPPSGPPP